MRPDVKDLRADTLYPVVLAVPPGKQRLRGRKRVDELSCRARRAVRLSARFSGRKLACIRKDDSGRPLPDGGTFWSLSHKSEYVAGVVTREATGIDVEKIRICSPALCRKIADEAEWRLADAMEGCRNRSEIFFRYWTSKEAVLKAAGVGLRGLPQCRITRIIAGNRLVVTYMDRAWPVEHFFFDGHIASVVVSMKTIKWSLLSHHNKRLMS